MPNGTQENRLTWSRHLEFVIACIGYAVGLGNVWRFPHLCYSKGGGAFLIPYFTCLLCLGIPLFFFEITFGQFASLGTIAVWEINPLFKGFGYTMVFVSAEIAIYYSIIIAISLYHLIASMQSTLPWTTCGNDWNTCQCRTFDMDTELEDPMMWYNDTGLNCTGIEFTTESIRMASEEHYYFKVLDRTSSIGEPGTLRWELALCNFAVWVFIYLSIMKGIKSLGKVAYITSLMPYVLLTALLVRGLTLPGASKGIDYYLSVDFDVLAESKTWRSAASQILFSLSCCMGSLMAMSSYNRFHSNAIRDSFVIPVINCATSFYAGFAIFSVLGFMSDTSGKDIGSVTTSGFGLVFVAYPAALGKMPLPQLWSVLFFLMMVFLGLGSQFPSVETIITAFQDEFPFLRRKLMATAFRILICLVGFLLGIPQTTQGGSYVTELCDIFIEFPLLLVGFLQVVAVVWIYGPKRFSEDMMLMLGYSKINRILFATYFKWSLLTVTPLTIIGIIIFNAVQYEPITSPEFPEWAEALGWLIVVFIMMWTPIWYIVSYCRRSGGKVSWKLLVLLNQPTPNWGPAAPQNRSIPRYRYVMKASLMDKKEDVNTGRANIFSITAGLPARETSV